MSPLRKQGSRAKNWIPASAGMTNTVSTTGTNYSKEVRFAREEFIRISYIVYREGCLVISTEVICIGNRTDHPM